MRKTTIDAKARDLVCFVRSDLITLWKSWSVGADDRASAPPLLYGSNSPVFGARVRPGSILWVVGRLPMSTDPALMAKIVVAGRIDLDQSPHIGPPRERRRFEETARAFRRAYRFVAFGHRGSSRYFPFNRASGALLRTVFGVREERSWKIEGAGAAKSPFVWQSSFGSRFRQPGVIARSGVGIDGKRIPGSRHLQELEKRAKNAVFLSWKHDDLSEGSPLDPTIVQKFVRALAAKSVFCWFDLFSLPGFRTEEEEGDLDRLLAQAYRGCRGVVVIASPNYGTRSDGSPRNYTLDEWNGFGGRPLRRIVWNPLQLDVRGTRFSRVPPSRRIPIPDPARAANRVSRMLP